jgi:hypothetical protein
MSQNRLSRLSALTALLTILSFCIGFAPFLPLTAAVCYPAAVLLGIIALATGIRALGQIRARGETGRALAWFGIWTGILAILAVIVATAITFTLLFLGVDYLQTLWPTPAP